MTRFLAALALALLPSVASATGWTLQKHSARAPGVGRCELHARDEIGNRLILSMWDHNRRKSRFRLVLILTPGGRATLPMPNGPVALGFAPSGMKASPLEGRLSGSDEVPRFTHDFPSLDAMRAFTGDITGPTLFVAQPDASPHTELLARFALSDGKAAMNRLLSCSFPLR
ncbi:hypothetical protein [Vannielia litorea]|uniref:hypothetical protein n=1 Tax=Vannielia litorea TaxID=1217970 RepID=UPI001BCF3234|nr:hypothetical protein [Vannielia litorea]MBS8225247.1 hypothetical protein [Vannielia litorea]